MQISTTSPLVVDKGNAVISDPSIPRLVAVTREAKRALRGAQDLPLTRFPFRVGRQCRSVSCNWMRLFGSRRRQHREMSRTNDIYLVEPHYVDILSISREHFTVEHVGGRFFLIDRDSACGTIVAGKRVGGAGRVEGRTELRSGDVIVVGPENSRYVFRFEASTG